MNAQGQRGNEDPSSSDRFDLDGFEVVNLRSCMNFPPGTSIEEKRARCRPTVYRYRYPNTRMSLGHTLKTGSNAVYGCHELEVYPSDLLTCGSGNTLIGLDMSGAFDDRGTPNNFTDDTPRGNAPSLPAASQLDRRALHHRRPGGGLRRRPGQRAPRT